MHKQIWFTCLLAVGVAGCPDIKTDPGEGVGDTPTAGPTVDFDPANAILPFPNNLALNPTTGKVALPVQCGEGPVSKALREGVLNTLDGFGTYEAAMQVTFSEALDPASLEGHIVLYQRTKQGSPLSTSAAIPVLLIPGTSTRFDSACANPKQVTTVTIIPMVPLEQKSSYDAAVLAGVKTATGAAFGSTFTWALISNTNSPVTFDDAGVVTANHTPLDPADPAGLAQLQGIAQLWKAHKLALDFLDQVSVKRADILVAWEFNTQTTTDPLDPSVSGSPASKIAVAGPLGTQSILGGATPTQFLTAAGLPCGAAVPCEAIHDILGGLVASTSYQQDTPNPLAGGAPVPGPWNDPVHPTMTKTNQIEFLATIPEGEMPAAGWPVVVFGHGLGSTKKSMLVIAPLLAAYGYAVVAIDFVDHDSRAVRTSTDAAIGCANVGSTAPVPPQAPQCFALFLSTNLAGTRDNIRQTVLDLEREISMVKACTATSAPVTCGLLQTDPANIYYLGISLGGIIGSTTVAVVPDIKAAVLNVPGMGLLDILENTANLSIRCSLVNALIDAGILTGDKWNPAQGTGLCTTDAWKTQPSYATFSSAARWVLDPADGANFAAKLAPKKFLIQEVVGDQVVPNIATDREGMLVGLSPLVADPATAFPPPPSAAITTDPAKNKWLRYPAVPGAGAFPGNTFQHASLLSPVADATGAGKLGTARLQSDAVSFLNYQHAH